MNASLVCANEFCPSMRTKVRINIKIKKALCCTIVLWILRVMTHYIPSGIKFLAVNLPTITCIFDPSYFMQLLRARFSLSCLKLT